MTNKEISHQFTLLAKLMDIHGENSFKSKSYSVCGFKISQLNIELENVNKKDIFSIYGFGESMGLKIIEIIDTGSMQPLKDLLVKTPSGILEIMKLKGIGAKKINLIWKDMEIENVGELLYACQENRLLRYKGFGKKTQDNVLESIGFYLSNQGSYLYAQLETLASELQTFFINLYKTENVFITGDFARQEETADVLEFVIEESLFIIIRKISLIEKFFILEEGEDYVLLKYADKIQVKVHAAEKKTLSEKVFITTGSIDFVHNFRSNFPGLHLNKYTKETDIFREAAIQYIPPFLREGGEIIQVAKDRKIPELIQPGDIKGIIHCHSNWSDGNNSLEKLAEACIRSGKEYLVLSDHSKSATYAQGLSEEKIKAQHACIDELNLKHSPFKIFKSIESDILNDGNLDYSNQLLSSFDLVISSVHSNLKMNEDKAMKRLLKAIENPFTTILGHMTGRLLLSRPGYPLDYKKIIDACASNNVVIEINANPRRLDMKWQWISYAVSKNVLLSINPDAHSLPEFDNIKYGVFVAQKGLVTAKNNLSSYSLKEFELYLAAKKIRF